MNDADFDVLATAAYKGERVAARRLAARSAVSEAQALHQVLTQVAGVQGLALLLAERSALRLRDEELRSAKLAEKALQLEQRAARMRPATDGWRGWFDGSAHPNPGQIGIGALLCGPGGERVEISRRAGYGNSGEAEYLALTALLEAAVSVGATGLVVHGDSQVVVNDVNLSAQAVAAGRGAKGLEEHRRRVTDLMAPLGAVSLHWVPRHRNGDADRLSQQAIDRSPGDNSEV
ncbi:MULTISPECIES: ribonuclease HI family protein [unclassified Duganella]|uniref:ribonuclease HI family protein n=1 Tax=unclassified Duganella TaxID=2636909 RepID=UPI000E340DCC|nr:MULTISPECIES: ribonuclease HI family protein [unclassified Duganella]RFP16347.1 RNase HI-like protein [Duganella sp. BJB475]RFP32492.1 RNase HI-like protein [Duganella sp. BJB476]